LQLLPHMRAVRLLPVSFPRTPMLTRAACFLPTWTHLNAVVGPLAKFWGGGSYASKFLTLTVLHNRNTPCARYRPFSFSIAPSRNTKHLLEQYTLIRQVSLLSWPKFSVPFWSLGSHGAVLTGLWLDLWLDFCVLLQVASLCSSTARTTLPMS
jgi:hypothetical protein